MAKRLDAVVVGAGPAGSAAATFLARAGARVLLLEKEHFPRRKVCGEFLASEAVSSLVRLGVWKAVASARPERIETGAFFLPGGRCVTFRLPAPAIGISRYRLDDLLAEAAREAGAQLRCGVRAAFVRGEPAGGFRIGIAGAPALDARTVIGAWGRWDALDRNLGRSFLSGRRFFAWSRDYAGGSPELAGRVGLYLFPGGYCGLSRVEEEVVHLAGVISERARRRLPAGWEAVLLHARRANCALDRDLAGLEPGPLGFLGTVPAVFAPKPPTEGGMLLVGDAAGDIDPFSGQGQAAALASGILAGETAARFLRGELGPRQYPAAYERAWRRLFRRRFLWGALLRAIILGPRLGDTAARVAGERLVRFGMRALGGRP